jgi:hypothetical protein
MSAPIDVLAVLQNEIDHAGRLDPRASDARAKRLGSVRAAVSELIDKVDACVTLGRSDTAYRELSAALARVKGDGGAA